MRSPIVYMSNCVISSINGYFVFSPNNVAVIPRQKLYLIMICTF